MSVSASIGPISGIDYGKLITGLSQGDQSQIDAITTKTDTLDKQSQALTDLTTFMTGLKISSAAFTSAGVFKATTANASNPGIINPTAGIGTPVGNYSFNVQRLASASQVVTQGFSSTNTALGLSGTINLRLGGGTLENAANLSTLNGGTGVARGSVRITDRSGATAVVDLSDAVDINDVVNSINSATGVSVSATVKNDHLVLTDNSGGSGNLAVANVGGTATASNLGLTAASVGGTLTGSSITTLQASTSLDSLNDGNGVRTAGILTDFSITGTAGTANLSLNGAKTLGDVIAKINAAKIDNTTTPTGITATISADGHGITLTDSGGGPINVSAVNGSLAAYDLGIQGTGTGGTVVGDQITSALQSPLLKNLQGGYQGQAGETTPQYGTILVNGTTVDLSSARSLDDVVSAINNSGTGVTAGLNSSSTGLALSSNAASFTVANGTGNLASFLNIAGTSTAGATGSTIASGDLHDRYISNNSQLSVLSGGSGFKAGRIKITDGNGATQIVDLSGTGISTVSDLLQKLNTTGLAISARVNDTGDGILLTQTGGSLNAIVQDFDSTQTAESLGIQGTFSGNQLNGSLLKSITIAATDTLSNIASKINNAGAGVASAIINDGSGATPYRLSLSSRNSGTAGRIVFDGSSAGLSGITLVQGQDAIVVYGGTANGTGGLTSTSASNAITGLVPGLTLNLTGVGQTSVAITRDNSQISTSVQAFVDSYNKVITNIAKVTNFDSSDPTQNGVLFGDPTVQQVQDALGSFVTKTYTGLGQYNSLASVGISVGQDGTLSLDSNKLDQALAANPTDVQSLFTTNIAGSVGGPRVLTATTALSTLNNSAFPGGHITITDGFGTAYDIDLTTASTIGDILNKINTGTTGKVTAGINATGDGLQLVQWGGTGTASVAEVGTGTTAAALNIKGVFTGGQLTGSFLPTLPTPTQKGIGATLSDVLTRFTDAQIGILFQATDSISTQETQLKSHQSDLQTLLTAKKNQLVMQFANLEVTIAQLQQQGSALGSLSTTTTASKA